MKEIRCGFLTYHPTLAGTADIVRYKGQWMPEALATGGKDKRFSDAELAAEFEAARCDAMVARANGTGTYWTPLGDTWSNNIHDAQDRAMTLLRFATEPHHDEQILENT